MKIERPKKTNDIVQTLFNEKFSNAEMDFGYVSIPAGERLPKEGTTFHEEHEYSFIINGSLSGESGGKSFAIKEGEASYIPAGEKHWCVNKNDAPCVLVYALIKV